ncbi:MAG TPA: DUF2780 domain-containing protein [Malonomonas sp.]
MELLQTLVSQLGVSEKQAKGGAGIIFNLAKGKLGHDEFGRIAELVPDMNELLSDAPKPGGIAGAIGGIASAFGQKAGHLGDLAGLASGFKSLDLDSGMVAKFIPLILDFVKTKGGEGLGGLLEDVLK